MVFAANLPAQQIYRWVDDTGVVHYSDQPRAAGDVGQAEKIDIAIPPGISNPTRAISVGASLDDEEPVGEDLDAYRDVSIVSPSDQQVIWNIATRLPVTLSIEPALAGSHRVQMLLDDQPIGNPISETTTTIEPVYRGEHRLTPVIIDTDGNTVYTGETRLFYVQQASTQLRRR